MNTQNTLQTNKGIKVNIAHFQGSPTKLLEPLCIPIAKKNSLPTLLDPENTLTLLRLLNFASSTVWLLVPVLIFVSKQNVQYLLLIIDTTTKYLKGSKAVHIVYINLA